MCQHVKFPDGSAAIICGGRHRIQYCACGRPCDFLCDWKVREKKSGTCDAPICAKHATQVGPDKHLCPQHQKAWESWQKRHPGFIAPPDYAQMSLLESKS
jgi:hypothetical protein